jgi:MFS family permease
MGFMLSSRTDNYLIYMYLLRAIFGFAGQGIIVSQGAIVAKYAPKHYEYIMGLCLNIPLIFNALSSIISSKIQQET